MTKGYNNFVLSLTINHWPQQLFEFIKTKIIQVCFHIFRWTSDFKVIFHSKMKLTYLHLVPNLTLSSGAHCVTYNESQWGPILFQTHFVFFYIPKKKQILQVWVETWWRNLFFCSTIVLSIKYKNNNNKKHSCSVILVTLIYIVFVNIFI